jgi:hypothetical protein
MPVAKSRENCVGECDRAVPHTPLPFVGRQRKRGPFVAAARDPAIEKGLVASAVVGLKGENSHGRRRLGFWKCRWIAGSIGKECLAGNPSRRKSQSRCPDMRRTDVNGPQRSELKDWNQGVITE